jgi:23S rRNA (adenine1618-N6)-methyltransferase
MDNQQENHLFKNINFDFLMCNPPFYSNDEEKIQNNETSKRNAPHSVNTAQPHEAIVEGGEVGFVKQFINESLILKERIKYLFFFF